RSYPGRGESADPGVVTAASRWRVAHGWYARKRERPDERRHRRSENRGEGPDRGEQCDEERPADEEDLLQRRFEREDRRAELDRRDRRQQRSQRRADGR